MTPERFTTLAQKLRRATTEGSVQWKSSPRVVEGGAAVYEADIGNSYSVRFYYRPSTESDDVDYAIDLIRTGQLIDSFTDIDMRDSLDKPYVWMKQFYREVALHAKGVPEAVEDIIAELDKKS
jgi:hypothetical protein